MIKQAVLKDLSSFKNPFFIVPILLISFVVFSLIILPKFKKAQQEKPLDQTKVDQIIKSNDLTAFTKLTQERGPQITYELMKQKFPNNDTGAHDFAHIIGIIAHDQKGIENLKVCDTAYNYGCYHGFIEAFIAKNTVAKVAQIEDGCIALGTVHAPSCLHGIGHGVMVDASYQLDTALDNCSVLQSTSQIYCWDGVFMERIVGSMLTGQNKPQMTAETLRQPCNSIATVYKEQCWRNQVSAWFQFFNANTKEIGTQCSLVEKEYQKTCFESLGLLVTITVGENTNQIINSCQVSKNPPVFDPEAQTRRAGVQISDDCLVGAMKELLFEGKNPAIAQSLCTAVSPANQSYCQQIYADHLSQSQARFGR